MVSHETRTSTIRRPHWNFSFSEVHLAKANLRMSKITVAVRVRPINDRERKSDIPEVLTVRDGQVNVKRPIDGDTKEFNFDLAYSQRVSEGSYGSQERIYKEIGAPILEGALEGINQCLFAYGQTV